MLIVNVLTSPNASTKSGAKLLKIFELQYISVKFLFAILVSKILSKIAIFEIQIFELKNEN